MANDPLANALNITPMVVAKQPENIPVVTHDHSILEQDFDYARENYKNMIELGSDALDEVLSVAKQSQAPRAFEVIATLISTLANVNKDLVALHKVAKELATESQPDNVTNNTLVLTTAQMLELLKKKTY